MGSFADRVNRRRLMGVLGLSGARALASAALPVAGAPRAATAFAAPAGHAEPAAAPAAAEEMSVDEMDAMHEAGVKAFPARTDGLGGQPLAFERDGDIKVFRLTCQVIDWEYAPGKTVEAFS